jgi:hypothetical protein
MNLKRRDVLAGMAASPMGGGLASAQGDDIPIIDTHCHLFDPRRPQGVRLKPRKQRGTKTSIALRKFYR